MDAPLQGDAGGHTGTAPTHLHHIFPRNPTQTKFRPCAIHPKRNQPSTHHPQNEINRPHAICQNETVGAAPACPPERPRSGVSIPKIHALCAGNERRMRPCGGDAGGHTGTAPTHLHHIFLRIPHKPNNHLRTILPNDTNHPHAIHPNETRKQSIHTSGAGMHRALPPP